jgi:hypothetical protein
MLLINCDLNIYTEIQKISPAGQWNFGNDYLKKQIQILEISWKYLRNLTD